MPEKQFLKKIFNIAAILRVIYVFFSFFFYTFLTGQPFEFEAADSTGYHETALWYIDLFKSGSFYSFSQSNGLVYSDMGYPLYLSLIYSIFGPSILIARIFKAILGAYTCILIYKLAKRNFGESTARLAAIMAMLLPNLIYYCGLHVKETEMTFLLVLFVERTDYMIRMKKINLRYMILPLVIGILLFFFRTVLGIAAFLSLITALLFTSKRIISNSYRIFTLFIGMVAIIVLMNSKLESEITRYWGESSINQEAALQAYTEAEDGNKFSKYGKEAIFAPIILVAPIPTLVNIENQQNQMYLNGGYYVRNIYAFFIFIILLYFWKTKTYKDHIFLLAITFSYLGILTLSKFALSERFHLPIVPFLLILAAYGMNKIQRKQIRYFNWYMILIAGLIVGWNWFKLAGRGMI